ncbi:MAG TPA: hypothetical protein DD417_03145 [Elusimicrobia bacterium]|nr:hypothetical protein [Elusimicrobiota bacterium]
MLPMPPLTLRGVVCDPPLFCAPMASITHSAFRRLLADFGGVGAVFTEMLSAKTILVEDPERSPYLKRRPQEGKVFYQLLVTDTIRLDETLARLAPLRPDGLDLNLACAAPVVRQKRGGAALFDDPERLAAVLRVLRKGFAGPLTAKIRLGRDTDGWRLRLEERLRLLEGEGVDAVILHPRFFEEKFKRSARHALYAELSARTPLPIIACGDVLGPDYVRDRAALFAPAAGIMVGRMAAAAPWVFARWRDPGLKVDPAEVWRRLCRYIAEDFEPAPALARIKIVAPYFARNFAFGHSLFKALQSAPDLAAALRRSDEFLSAGPEPSLSVGLEGI